MRARTVFLVLCLLLAACAGRSSPAGPGSESPASATLELVATPEEPQGIFTWDGEDVQAELGTHCWTTQCVDFIGPPTPTTFTEIPGDLTIDLTGDGRADSISVGHPPEEEFGPLVDEEQVPVENDRVQFDLEPGRYVLVIFATWDEGDGVLTLGLDVA
jgi:hypothetical protein